MLTHTGYNKGKMSKEGIGPNLTNLFEWIVEQAVGDLKNQIDLFFMIY